MSRIHDALRRAEQERAASVPLVGHSKEASNVQPIAIGSSQPTGEGETSSWEELTARCAQKTWSPDTRTMLFFNEEERVGMEEFRVLRSRLDQLQERTGIKKLLITSALPREGKSFMAENLAQVLVHRNGKKALLIDGDLRAPRLHADFGTDQEPGLSEFLRGEVDEFGVIQRGPMEGLFAIPAGRKHKNPAELISNGRLKQLLSRLQGLFDWIVIDSPPLLVSDTVVMATYCDGVLIVVRAGLTAFEVARKAQREIDEKLVLGAILNGIDPNQSPYTHYYYNYYRTTHKDGTGSKQKQDAP